MLSSLTFLRGHSHAVQVVYQQDQLLEDVAGIWLLRNIGKLLSGIQRHGAKLRENQGVHDRAVMVPMTSVLSSLMSQRAHAMAMIHQRTTLWKVGLASVFYTQDSTTPLPMSTFDVILCTPMLMWRQWALVSANC